MIKKILKSVREYKLVSILTIVFISLEVILDVFIPILMTKIIDIGINQKSLNIVLLIGESLVLVALFSLIFGWKICCHFFFWICKKLKTRYVL